MVLILESVSGASDVDEQVSNNPVAADKNYLMTRNIQKSAGISFLAQHHVYMKDEADI